MLQCFFDLAEYGGIVDGGGDGVFFAVGDLSHGAAQYLAGAGLGEPFDEAGLLEARYRADSLADHLDELGDDLFFCAGDARLEDEEADGDLALEVVVGSEDGALGYVGVGGDYLFHRAGGEAVARYVDYVVYAAHDVEVAVGVFVAAVAGEVVAGEGIHVGFLEALVVVPQGGQTGGGQRGSDDDDALFVGAKLFA